MWSHLLDVSPDLQSGNCKATRILKYSISIWYIYDIFCTCCVHKVVGTGCISTVLLSGNLAPTKQLLVLSNHLFFGNICLSVAVKLFLHTDLSSVVTLHFGKFISSWLVPYIVPVCHLFVFLTDLRTKDYVLQYCDGAFLPHKLTSYLIIRVFTVCHRQCWDLLGTELM